MAALLGGGAHGGQQARLISTEAVAVTSAAGQPSDARHRLLVAVERADVAAALVARGVDPQQARERLMALTDAEAAELARGMDAAPAGAYWLSPFFVASLFVALVYAIHRLDLVDWVSEALFPKGPRGGARY